MRSLAALALLAVLTPSPGASAGGPPSVVLITMDTTRADHLGCWGGSAATPALDRLAARGVRFARCDTAAPVTLPSHATLMTGLLPPRHGVRDNGRFRLAPRFETVAERFRATGHDTGAVVAAVVLARRFGLDQGFRIYDDALGGRESRPADEVTAAALACLGDLRRPFLLWVHYYDPHTPYDPPPELVRGSGIVARYDGEIAAMDRAIGRLLEALPEKTVVVAVGDHGEMLGDHGEATHGILLERGARRVPLIIAGPGVRHGVVVRDLVATADVAPTVAALGGVAFGPCDGRSLVPALRGRPIRGRTTYCESLLSLSAYRWHPLRALSDGRWLFVAGARNRLYDLRRDPAERRDVAAENPRLARRWTRRLTTMSDRWGDLRAPSPETVSPETRRSLASLGYLGGGPGGVNGEPLPDPYDLVWISGALLDAGRAVEAGRCNEAMPVLRRILTASSGTVPALQMAGICTMREGRYEAALRLFRRAASLDPTSASARAGAGGCLVRLGRDAAAMRAWRDALALDPALPEAAVNLAHLLRMGGRPREALDVLDRALEAGGPHPRLLLERGLIEAEAGRIGEALAAFRLGLRLAPDDPDLVENAAHAAYASGDDAEAVRLYRRLAALRPRDPRPWKTAGAILLDRLEDPSAAREAFRRALEVESDPGERRELERIVAGLAASR